MPEHIRAYIFVLTIALLVFAYSKKTICTLSSYHNFDSRRNAWLFLTSVAFITANFWIYSLVAVIVFFYVGSRDANKLGLFYCLLFILPPVSMSISGGGVFNQLIAISHPRLLSMCILVPLIFKIPGPIFKINSRVDLFVIAYFMLSIFQNFSHALSFTDAVRYVLYDFTDFFVPYIVFSRYLGTIKQLYDVLLSYITAAGVLSALAVFEFVKGWLLYVSLAHSMGLNLGVNEYIARAGHLRAMASTTQPIALCYVLMIAIGFWMAFKEPIKLKNSWNLGVVLLGSGLLATLSRGPWFGLAVLLFVFVITGRQPILNLFKLGAAAAVALMGSLLTSTGRNIVATLPFIGDSEQENVEFRHVLFDAASEVIMRKPFFGTADYRSAPEFLAITSGQLDIVNSYLIIALSSGLVGVFIFCMAFLAAITSVHRIIKKLPNEAKNHKTLGRVLMAALIATLFTLATVSSISFIPIVYWSLLGLAVAYSRILLTTEKQ